jgi:hypothetical protein
MPKFQLDPPCIPDSPFELEFITPIESQNNHKMNLTRHQLQRNLSPQKTTRRGRPPAAFFHFYRARPVFLYGRSTAVPQTPSPLAKPHQTGLGIAGRKRPNPCP